MKKILLNFILLVSINSYSQTVDVIWSKFFGTNRGEAFSLEKTKDGGYIVAGKQDYEDDNITNSVDGMVVKFDSNDNIEWSNRYGAKYAAEWIRDIKQTRDGGYIFVGWGTSVDKGYDFWIVKINKDGKVEWEKKYGGSKYDNAESVVENSLGEFIIVGSTRSMDGDFTTNYGYTDYLLMKLDQNGNLLSQKNLGGSLDDYGFGIAISPDDSYIVVGEAQSTDNDVTCRNTSGTICKSAFWVVKFNKKDQMIWKNCYSSIANGLNYFSTAFDVITTNDGGYAVVGQGRDGYLGNTFGEHDFWIIKIDSNGFLQWKKFYGGSKDDNAYSIKQTADNGFIIAGKTESSDNQVIDKLGKYSVENGWVIKTDKNGKLEWQRLMGSSNFGFDSFNDVVEIRSNEYIVVGTAGADNEDCLGNNGRGFWVTKLSDKSILSTTDYEIKNVSISPIPSDDKINIESTYNFTKVEILDLNGRIVYKINHSNINEIDITSLSKGIYLLNLSNDNITIKEKIIKK